MSYCYNIYLNNKFHQCKILRDDLHFLYHGRDDMRNDVMEIELKHGCSTNVNRSTAEKKQ